MKKYAGTISLAVVLVALALYVYLTEFRRPPAPGPEKLLAHVEASAVRQVMLRSGEGTIVGRRVGDGWRLSEPRDFSGDKSVWDGIASTLAEATLDSKVVDNPPDLSLYGLANPRLVVMVGLESGPEQTVELGDDNPRQSGVYVRRQGEQAVWLLPSYRFSQLDRDLEQLRAHQLALLGEGDPQRITLHYGTGSVVELTKVENAWRLITPEDAPASASAVGSLVNSLRFAQVTRFIDEPEDDPAVYGFDAPTMVLSLELGPLSTRTLTIGKAVEDEEGLYYARIDTDPAVVLLNDSLVRSLTPQIESLRQAPP
ncbi:MAG: DUF4340 domain-containing protein [Deinococcus sp.]|nr:DUF4340 domain-containing protein [Deinococcus sp.]